MITKAILHYQIIKGILDNGFAPSIKSLSDIFKTDEEQIINALHELQRYHGVVLHPNEPKIWVIHPFSLAPTNFYVQSDKGQWWGNCAWCSLGIAALLKENVKITTTIGAETKQIEINIINGEIQEKNYFIHFPIPMKNAWDNVIYTCSNCLFLKMKNKLKAGLCVIIFLKGTFSPLKKFGHFQKNGMVSI